MTRFLWLPVCAGILASTLPSAHATDPAPANPAPANPAVANPAGANPAGANPAGANPAGADAAAQVVGLFMQSCVRFAGDPTGLRAWAPTAGMQPLPAAGQQAFLYGLPGVVFDASTKSDKLVLISENEGACSAMTESASGPLVVKTLEETMRQAHIDFTLTHEGDDQQEKTLHHREYNAAQGKRHWEMLISTVKGDAPGEVMLTTSR
jgi:hypothetical protein